MPKNTAILRSAFLFTIAMAFALVLGYQIIYRTLIVPRLPNWNRVPLVWWILALLPVIAVCVIAGTKVKSFLEVCVLSLTGALCGNIYGYFVAVTNQPGLKKSLAIEAPVEYWTLDLLSNVLFVFVLLWTSRLLSGKIRSSSRKRATDSLDR